MKTLKAKLQGTWNYYGLIGNFRRLSLFYRETCRTLHKWLNRRSQRRSLTWRALNRMLQRFPSASAAHCGRTPTRYALPEGTEFLPAADGLSEAGGSPDGECESELT